MNIILYVCYILFLNTNISVDTTIALNEQPA